MTYIGFDGLEYYDREWDDMKRPDPEDTLMYQAAMEKLDRVEGILRGLLRKNDSNFISRVLHIAIDRAVSKRIRLVTAWWKE